MQSDDYAVVVGVSRYPGLGNLGGPENDALDFAAWLASPCGGQLPECNIDLVLSSRYPVAGDPLDEAPTTREVDRAFDAHYRRGDQRGRAGRRLYIYMAGHGFAPNLVFGPNLEDAALLMANASPGMTGYHIAGRPYADWFRAAAFFDEVILFMDCCRENYARAPLRGPPYVAVRAPQSARYCYGFATEWSKAAREAPVTAGGPIRGLFTLALLAGLRGAAPPDENGNVTSASLERFVFQYLQARTDADDRQEPRFFYDAMHDIVFTRPAAPALRIVVTPSTPPVLTPPITLVDGGYQSLAPLHATPPRYEWAVPRIGLYKLSVGATSQVVEVDGTAEVTNVLG